MASMMMKPKHKKGKGKMAMPKMGMRPPKMPGLASTRMGNAMPGKKMSEPVSAKGARKKRLMHMMGSE